MPPADPDDADDDADPSCTTSMAVDVTAPAAESSPVRSTTVPRPDEDDDLAVFAAAATDRTFSTTC